MGGDAKPLHKQIVKHIERKPRRRRGKLCALSGICGAIGCAGRHASCQVGRLAGRQFFIVSPWGTSQGRTITHNFPAAIGGSASCGLPQGYRQAEAKPPLPAVVPVASGEGIGSGLCSSESRPAKNLKKKSCCAPAAI